MYCEKCDKKTEKAVKVMCYGYRNIETGIAEICEECRKSLKIVDNLDSAECRDLETGELLSE